MAVSRAQATWTGASKDGGGRMQGTSREASKGGYPVSAALAAVPGVTVTARLV